MEKYNEFPLCGTTETHIVKMAFNNKGKKNGK